MSFDKWEKATYPHLGKDNEDIIEALKKAGAKEIKVKDDYVNIDGVGVGALTINFKGDGQDVWALYIMETGDIAFADERLYAKDLE